MTSTTNEHGPVRSTTIVAVRRDGKVAIAGDGQVSMGETVIKSKAKKVRRLAGGRVIVGFAGASADAFTLFSRLESKLEEFNQNLSRAAVELAKEWRTDRVLRRLEALVVAADLQHMLLVSGNGDVIEADDDVISVGSGGGYARAAALALMRHTAFSASEIAKEALDIAAGICIYTNREMTIEELP